MKAIAAMSRNRVIGCAGKVPWHLPEELRWFKSVTVGQAVLMGRRTFESIGSRALLDRLNLVVTRGEAITAPGVVSIRDVAGFREEDYAPREVWVIGGAEMYSQLLRRCSELFLTAVNREVDGDTLFPAFEEDFALREIVLQREEFEVRRYLRR